MFLLVLSSFNCYSPKQDDSLKQDDSSKQYDILKRLALPALLRDNHLVFQRPKLEGSFDPLPCSPMVEIVTALCIILGCTDNRYVLSPRR
jgi:hypothetical protein